VPTGRHVCGHLSFIIRGAPFLSALRIPLKHPIGSSWYTRPRRPPAGRLPARHAHACHAPSGSAAGASRHHSDRRTFLVSRRLPLQTASHPRVGTGNVPRPRLRVGLAIPPPTPTPAHGTHCPPMAASAASAFGASACGASACGAISVPPDFSGPLPSVHSPLHLFDSALLFSARCLPAKSTS